MADYDFNIVRNSNDYGSPLYAQYADGRLERLYENALGPNSGYALAGLPYYSPESQYSQYVGKMMSPTDVQEGQTFSMPSSYVPATFKFPRTTGWDDVVGQYLPYLFMAGATYGVGSAAAGGAAAAGEGAATAGAAEGAAAAGGAEGAGAAAGGSAMPAAIPELDPTFGGVLTQTSPGVYAAGGSGAMMPAAVPEADPTFGGELTQTAPGAYENLGNTAAFGGDLAPSATAMSGGGMLAASAASGASGGGSGGSSGGSGGSGTSGGGGSGSDGFFGLQDDEWLRRLSYGIPGLLGAIGAGSQAEDYEDLAHQYQQMGAPYRSRLEQLYGNPQAFLNSPEVRVPIQQGTDMLARSLSVKGNPAGSGNALQELQNYASNQLFSRLGQEKDRLAGFGGLSQYNQAAPQAATNVIGAQGNIYSNLGGAAADIFNPPRRYRLEDLLGAY